MPRDNDAEKRARHLIDKILETTDWKILRERNGVPDNGYYGVARNTLRSY